jgi:Lrp/AsnC ligand binding domain
VRPKRSRPLADAVRDAPEIEDCWFVAGEETFVVEARVPDVAALEGTMQSDSCAGLPTPWPPAVDCRRRPDTAGHSRAALDHVRAGQGLLTARGQAVGGLRADLEGADDPSSTHPGDIGTRYDQASEPDAEASQTSAASAASLSAVRCAVERGGSLVTATA